MILTVDTVSPVPPYEQIRGQIEAMVAAGSLVTGERLPPIRQLANDLGVATGTVARAYTELERQGLIASRRRTGTVVTGQAAPAAERRRRLEEAAAQYARTVRLLGVEPEEAEEAVSEALTSAQTARA